MCQHSLQQVHILIDASTVYNKYIYSLMRQHSPQQVHIEQHEPLKHKVNACDPKEEAFSVPLLVSLCYKPGNKSSSRIRCVSTVYIKNIYLLIRLNSLHHTHWSINTVYIIPPDPSTQSTTSYLLIPQQSTSYLLIRQHSLHHTYWSINTVYIILTDPSAQSTSYLLIRQHSIHHTYWSVNIVYIILTDPSTQLTSYLLIRQHSLHHIYWCFNIVYSKYIYLLMRQNSLQQVHVLNDAST